MKCRSWFKLHPSRNSELECHWGFESVVGVWLILPQNKAHAKHSLLGCYTGAKALKYVVTRDAEVLSVAQYSILFPVQFRMS